jgi:hypothetical protein
MPTPTYDLIASTTLAASTSEVLFDSLPQNYRDLIIVAQTSSSANNSSDIGVRFNGDGGSNYSFVEAAGNGSSASTNQGPQDMTYLYYTLGTNRFITIAQVFDYSATDKHKATLVRASSALDSVIMNACRWANTAAVTSLTFRLDANQFATGSTFSIYGVIA